MPHTVRSYPLTRTRIKAGVSDAKIALALLEKSDKDSKTDMMARIKGVRALKNLRRAKSEIDEAVLVLEESTGEY